MDFVSQWSEISDVYVDALKDTAVKLTDDEVGSRVNAEIQEVIANDIEVVDDHHQRKASADNKKPRTLADVYGSTWSTTGHGSVLLLWGEAGDPIIELSHLKQPASEVGPLKMLQGPTALGSVSIYEAEDLVELGQRSVTDSPPGRLPEATYGTENPTRNQIEKAREAQPSSRAEEGQGLRADCLEAGLRWLEMAHFRRWHQTLANVQAPTSRQHALATPTFVPVGSANLLPTPSTTVPPRSPVSQEYGKRWHPAQATTEPPTSSNPLSFVAEVGVEEPVAPAGPVRHEQRPRPRAGGGGRMSDQPASARPMSPNQKRWIGALAHTTRSSESPSSTVRCWPARSSKWASSLPRETRQQLGDM